MPVAVTVTAVPTADPPVVQVIGAPGWGPNTVKVMEPPGAGLVVEHLRDITIPKLERLFTA